MVLVKKLSSEELFDLYDTPGLIDWPYVLEKTK